MLAAHGACELLLIIIYLLSHHSLYLPCAVSTFFHIPKPVQHCCPFCLPTPWPYQHICVPFNSSTPSFNVCHSIHTYEALHFPYIHLYTFSKSHISASYIPFLSLLLYSYVSVYSGLIFYSLILHFKPSEIHYSSRILCITFCKSSICRYVRPQLNLKSQLRPIVNRPALRLVKLSHVHIHREP